MFSSMSVSEADAMRLCGTGTMPLCCRDIASVPQRHLCVRESECKIQCICKFVVVMYPLMMVWLEPLMTLPTVCCTP